MSALSRRDLPGVGIRLAPDAAFGVIVWRTEHEHIVRMSLAASRSAKKSLRPASAAPLYRGVRLQKTAGRSKFTLAQIRKAVETAVSKNADALAGRS